MAIEITVPRLGWTMEEGIFQGWLKKDGERVSEGEALFTLEGEKSAQDIEAPGHGVLQIAPDTLAPGCTVRVGALLGYLVAEGESVTFGKAATVPAEASADAPTGRMQESPGVSSVPTGAPGREQAGGTAISPRAARTASALGIDIAKVRGTGSTGRIRERDVLAAAAQNRSPDRPAPVSSEVAPSDLPGRTLPISQTRRTIARRMSAGVHDAAPVTLNARADATHLVLARKRMKDAVADEERVPSFNDILVKLCAVALEKHPLLQTQWRNDTLFVPDSINIAVAMDSDSGLTAPVIRDVTALTILQIGAASRALADAARAGRLSAEDLQGGTFTVSNLGAFGIDHFSPIINLPQSAILGIGRIAREPVADGDHVVLRDIVSLSLTFDHRAIDGAPAARFLETFRHLIENIENPGKHLNH